MNDTRIVQGPASDQTSHAHRPRLRGLAGTGIVATLAAMVATTLAAALAKAVGVDFEIPDGGETIPLPGFAVVTGSFSLVPPLLSGADTATTISLIGLHLVAATVMIPTLARSLRT